MSGLRVCIVTTFYPPFNFGGDGIGIQQLARALVRRGHHVTVLHDVETFKALNGGVEPEVQPDSDEGVELVRLRSRVGVVSPLLTHQTGRPVLQGRTLRRVLDEGRFDVISFDNASLVGGAGMLSAGGGALKLYKAHEYWLVCPTHDLWRHGRENCVERQCVRCTLRYKRPPQLWRYTGYLERQLRYVDTFIVPSEFCRDKHYEFGFPREMEVVPYFLPDPDPAAAAPADDAPHDRPYFLYVGRLKRIKGLDDVIPVFRDYEDADFLIVGDGDHGPTLMKLAAGNPSVKFLGRVPNEELGRYYRHAIASIMPTVTYETFGITVIESFRQSTPVIARDMAAPAEILGLCGGGELFREPGELVAAMKRLQSDPALRDRLGRAGYDGYVSNWSESAVVPRYLDVVRRTAEATGRMELASAVAAAIGS